MLMWVLVVLLVVVLALLLLVLQKLSVEDPAWALALQNLAKDQQRLEHMLKEEMLQNRNEWAQAARLQRQDTQESFKHLGELLQQRLQQQELSQKNLLEAFAGQLSHLGQSTSTKFDHLRMDTAAQAQYLREEVVRTLSQMAEGMTSTLKELASAEKLQLERVTVQMATLTQSNTERLDALRQEAQAHAKHLREEVLGSFKTWAESNQAGMNDWKQAQQQQLESMTLTLAQLSGSNAQKLEEVRLTVAGQLQSMQKDNAQQLELMRQTVDEKLQGTLEKRLGESFKQVSERLEQVHKGLGEMQNLATGVGDLKKVLTNVKSRGTWGEVQLGALLEQVLTHDQYATNVATSGGAERVEFAIKLPGQGQQAQDTVWLPIDAKFPVEDYQRLLEAQERGDSEAVESSGKQLEMRVKACAKDISSKYLNPPLTTDFGILFLPIEGLFAEVIRRPGLSETIQREQRVVLAGPTTLWSILNSLQMGFRTLAIQERSSEVWKMLAAVKTEWGKYGEVLEAVQKKLQQASDSLEKVQVRSRAVGRKLKDVQALPSAEATQVLPLELWEGEAEEESRLP